MQQSLKMMRAWRGSQQRDLMIGTEWYNLGDRVPTLANSEHTVVCNSLVYGNGQEYGRNSSEMLDKYIFWTLTCYEM